MWPLDLSKGLVSVKEYFDSDKKKCFNAADYDSKANKICCFHLYKLFENPTFWGSNDLNSIEWCYFVSRIPYEMQKKSAQRP